MSPTTHPSLDLYAGMAVVSGFGDEGGVGGTVSWGTTILPCDGVYGEYSKDGTYNATLYSVASERRSYS